MTEEEIASALKDVDDQAIAYHGYTDYIRDYEVVVAVAGASQPLHYRHYLFRFCVEATIQTSISPEIWRRSLDDSLVEQTRPTTRSTGYAWGARWQELYPGWKLVKDSRSAIEWAEKLAIPMFEVEARANAHSFSLVFGDLEVSDLPTGWSPFVVVDVKPTDHSIASVTFPLAPDS